LAEYHHLHCRVDLPALDLAALANQSNTVFLSCSYDYLPDQSLHLIQLLFQRKPTP